MKKFLDEYGSAIAYAIFAILLIAGFTYILNIISTTPANLK